MSTTKRAAPILLYLLTILAAVAAVQLTPINWPSRPVEQKLAAAPETPQTPSTPRASEQKPEPPAAPDATANELSTALGTPPDESRAATSADAEEKPSFDVVRINPEGTSVFAGRAKPNDTVTILADGRPIGTTSADENGEWTLASEEPFGSQDPNLSISTDPELAVKAAAAEAPDRSPDTVEEADASEPSSPAGGPTAKEVTAGLIKDLEGMVDEARKTGEATRLPPVPVEPSPPPAEARAVTAAADAVPTSAPALEVADAANAVTAAPEAPQDTVRESPAAPAAGTKIVPVPIMFVYRESTFTSEGERAVGLLLEYLRLKGFASVTLTGHADERGTPELNMDLSRARLEAVAQVLKDGGYQGEVNLVAKGESEPYAGVDRTRYAREELYQLDRRVELRVMQ